MANSRNPGPLCVYEVLFNSCVPARSSGPLGINDQGDPQAWSWLGDTPGALGINDRAAPMCSDALRDQLACFRVVLPDASPLSTKSPKVTSTAQGSVTKLTDADFQAAAEALGTGVSVAIVQAFAEVESGGKSGFGPTGLPIIAYEGHIFRKLTGKKFDKAHPFLSYPYVKKAGPEWQHNNNDQGTAWKTLNDAMVLNQDAALQSCSWGMFQVMGFNYKICGYKNVDDFVVAMKAGERGQLDAFVGFCKSTQGLTQALANKDFANLAKLYNGEDYGDYDKLIEKSYKKHEGT